MILTFKTRGYIN